MTVIELFNEFILCSKHTLMLAILLCKMELYPKAFSILYFLRDLVEDTNNNAEAIIVYEEMGKIYQEIKEYPLAIKCFKIML